MKIISYVMVPLLSLNACSPSTNPRTHSTLSPAAMLQPLDVALLGLPVADASTGFPEVNPLNLQGNNGELIVPLAADARAPFNGVLFNGPAVARVSVEYRAQQERCLIDSRRALGLVEARYNADTSTLNLALDSERATATLLLLNRDLDIARLNRVINLQQTEATRPRIGEGLIWGAGGLIVGALLVGGIVIFTTNRP